MSPANSGGVFSRVCLIVVIIPLNVSEIALRISFPETSVVAGIPFVTLLPRTSIVSVSYVGTAAPRVFLIFSAVVSPIINWCCLRT